MSKIALIVGSGNLPQILINKLKESSVPFFVLAIYGNTEPKTIEGVDSTWVNIGEVGKAIDVLKNNDVTDISFVGHIKRPPLLSLKVDLQGMKILKSMGISKLSGGADNIHTVVMKVFEKAGFNVLPPESICPNILSPEGVLGKINPTKSDYKDIEIGKDILLKLGNSDVGQAVIVENGYVIGIEAAEGTNNLIKRCGDLKQEKESLGVLVKMKKSHQEEKIDLPTVGVDTIKALHHSGFRGVAMEKNNTLIIDINEVQRVSDSLGVFVVGI